MKFSRDSGHSDGDVEGRGYGRIWTMRKEDSSKGQLDFIMGELKRTGAS